MSTILMTKSRDTEGEAVALTGSEKPWNIGFYKASDKPAILAANRAEYGDSCTAQDAYLDWFTENNSVGPPVFPVACELGTNRIIGFVICPPVRMVWRARNFHALVGYNMMVEKSSRRRGVAAEIIRAGVEEGGKQGYHFIAGLTNASSLEVNRKAGALIVAQIPLVIRPLDIDTLTQHQFTNKIIKWIIRFCWTIGEAILFRDHLSEADRPQIQIVEEYGFDDRFDHFWETIKSKYELMLVRDRQFLHWRFRDCPDRDYQILSANLDGKILGYLVLRQAEVRGVPCGLIVDFLVQPGKKGKLAGLALLQEATTRFRAERLALAGGLMFTHTDEFKLLRQAGFFPCPTKFAPQSFTLIVHPLPGEIPHEVLAKPDSWFVTIADHDAV